MVFVPKLQLVWDAVYDEEPGQSAIYHTVLPSMAVFGVSIQRTCEWRAGFGSSALTFLNAYFDNNPGFETDEARVAYAQKQLKGYKFLYEYAEGDDRTVGVSPSLRTTEQRHPPDIPRAPSQQHRFADVCPPFRFHCRSPPDPRTPRQRE